MADEPGSSGKGPWFTRKIGPLPVWAYGLIAVGGWYWYTHYGPGAKSAAQQQAAQQGAGGGVARVFVSIRDTVTRTVTREPGPPPPPPAPVPQPRDDDDHRDRDRRDRDRRFRRPREPLSPPGSPIIPLGTPREPLSPPSSPLRPVQPPIGRPPPPPPGGPVPTPTPVPARDRDFRRRVRETVTASAATTGQPGQPVSAQTGQPVYWEWTHAHRPPEVAYQVGVPQPQQAYAPMTGGATYDAASAAAELAG